MRFDLYGRTHSEPKQGFCFDCIDARERNQPRRLLLEGFEQMLHRPIETTPFLRMWQVDFVMLVGVCSVGRLVESSAGEAYDAHEQEVQIGNPG